MTVSSRRIGAFIASVWLTVWLTILPIQTAQAFVWSPGLGVKFPPPPGGASPVTPIAFTNPWGAAIATIGTIILTVCIRDGVWVCFKPLNAAQEQQLVEHVVPKVDSTVAPNFYLVGSGGCHNTPRSYSSPSIGGFCQQAQDWNNARYAECGWGAAPTIVPNGPSSCTAGISANVACSNGGTFRATDSLCHADVCPSGTQVNAQGQCIASNQYASDGSPTLRSTGNGEQSWTSDPADPDPVPDPQSVPAPVTVTGTDPSGNPTQDIVRPTADGGLQVQHLVQNQINSNTANSNNTTTTTTTVTINNAGSVVNSTTVTNYGGIDSQGGPAIDIPNDYNREATQQQVLTEVNKARVDLDSMKTKQEEIATELKGDGAGAAPSVPDYNQKKDDEAAKIQQKFDQVSADQAADKAQWFSWVWTPQIFSCSPVGAVVHGKSMSLMTGDFCGWAEKIRDGIGWLFALFGAWSIYNEMFRRED